MARTDSYDYHADAMRETRDELMKRRNVVQREIRERERHLAVLDETIRVLDKTPEVRRGRP